MLWKSGGEFTDATRGSRPWGLAARLAIAFGTTAFCLLLVATALLYWALAGNLDREDNEYLGQKVGVLETLLREQPRDVAELREEVGRESQQHFYPPVMIRVFNGAGEIVAETDGMAAALPPDHFPKPVAFRAGWRGLDQVSAGGRPFCVLAVKLSGNQAAGGGHLVQIALDQSQETQLLSQFRRWLWLVLGLGLVVSAAAGHEIARRGLRPIGRMAATVRRIGSDNLDQRVDPHGFPAELSALASTFNAMLGRLEDSFQRLSRFSADIAHELRTPINNVSGLVEVILAGVRSSPEQCRLIGPCLDECRRLSGLIDDLLFLARSENPQTQINRHLLDVAGELETIREFYDAGAADAAVTLSLNAPSGITLPLDRVLFQRAIGNLVENALAHTPAGGSIVLSAADGGGCVRVEVADSGCGIPADHLRLIFNRFHRVDAARSRHSGGTGLGLAIVKSVMTMHGGTIEAASEPGVGSRFTLSFPMQHFPTPNPSASK